MSATTLQRWQRLEPSGPEPWRKQKHRRLEETRVDLSCPLYHFLFALQRTFLKINICKKTHGRHLCSQIGRRGCQFPAATVTSKCSFFSYLCSQKPTTDHTRCSKQGLFPCIFQSPNATCYSWLVASPHIPYYCHWPSCLPHMRTLAITQRTGHFISHLIAKSAILCKGTLHRSKIRLGGLYLRGADVIWEEWQI